MNCERCQIELEDLLYGELGEARAAAVRAHLAACAECRAVQAGLEREAEIFAAYYEQNALEPSEEMWDAIRARIQDEPRPAPRSAGLFDRLSGWLSASVFGSLLTPAALRQAVFASLLVVLSVGATVLYFRLTGGNSTRQDVATTATPAPQVSPTQQSTPQSAAAPPRVDETPRPQIAGKRTAPSPTAPATIKRAEPRAATESEAINAQVARAVREYQGAVKLLESAVAKRKQELDPGAVAQYERSLALIDDSIAASRRALGEHPGDVTAARFLLAAYSKKVELMQEIAMR
jgi:anti-sigma factor RsiW